MHPEGPLDVDSWLRIPCHCLSEVLELHLSRQFTLAFVSTAVFQVANVRPVVSVLALRPSVALKVQGQFTFKINLVIIFSTVGQ